MTTPSRSSPAAYKRMQAPAARLLVWQIEHYLTHLRLGTSTEAVTAGFPNRGRVVQTMARLEASGYVSRPPGGRWSEGWITEKARREEPRVRAVAAGPDRKPRARSVPDMFTLIEGRTRFPSAVIDPAGAAHVLMPGRYTVKLGERVTKGRWAGLPIYYLTLEERATCPRSCKVWDVCYGNNMHRVKRFSHADERALTTAVDRDLSRLHPARGRKPEGLVVRLHELGDFFSVSYVRWWAGALRRYPGLRVFGFTSWPPDSEIGAAVHAINATDSDRWRVRFSGRPDMGPHGAAVAFSGLPEPPGVRCPEQTGRTESCGTCGLCWTMAPSVVFSAH